MWAVKYEAAELDEYTEEQSSCWSGEFGLFLDFLDLSFHIFLMLLTNRLFNDLSLAEAWCEVAEEPDEVDRDNTGMLKWVFDCELK